MSLRDVLILLIFSTVFLLDGSTSLFCCFLLVGKPTNLVIILSQPSSYTHQVFMCSLFDIQLQQFLNSQTSHRACCWLLYGFEEVLVTRLNTLNLSYFVFRDFIIRVNVWSNHLEVILQRC